MRTEVVAPGAPEYDVICTPGIEPANLFSTDMVGTSWSLSVLIVEAAPVKVDFLNVP